jgi:hypothetical protein
MMFIRRTFSNIILLSLMAVFAGACQMGFEASSDDGNSQASASVSTERFHILNFTEDNVDLGIADVVSPETILLDDGTVRLYTTSMGGIEVYDAADGLTFVKQVANTPLGSDPTVLKLDDGTYRMYYLDHMDSTIKTATSPDGLNFTNEGSTGITNTTGDNAWGVPDTIVAPDGTVRMFWVSTESGQQWEVIKSATSTDGVTFTVDSGFRTTGGLVDPFLLLASGDLWLGLFATSPGMAPQKIFLGNSSDGVLWSFITGAIIEVDGGNALDATAVNIGTDTYRVYYVATTGADPFSGWYLRSGVLTVQ